MSPLILNFPWLVLQVAVNQQLATLEEQLHPEGPIMQRVTSAGEDEVDVAVAGRKAEAEISILRRQQEDAYTKRASLEQRAELRQSKLWSRLTWGLAAAPNHASQSSASQQECIEKYERARLALNLVA